MQLRTVHSLKIPQRSLCKFHLQTRYSALAYTDDKCSGGGAFGVTAGVKVGYKMSDSTAKAENSAKDTKRMTITYNVSHFGFFIARMLSWKLTLNSSLELFWNWTERVWIYQLSARMIWQRSIQQQEFGISDGNMVASHFA